MTDYSKITALYSRLSVGDEDRDGGESNSIQNQKTFLENYARGRWWRSTRAAGQFKLSIDAKTGGSGRPFLFSGLIPLSFTLLWRG